MVSRHCSFLPALSFTSALAKFLSASAILTLAAASLAQEPETTAEPNVPPSPQTTSTADKAAPDAKAVTVPAGAHLTLVLTHPVDSKSTHRGDEVFAQSSAPLAVDNQVVIPAGTFVQGKVEKLTRRGTR